MNITAALPGVLPSTPPPGLPSPLLYIYIFYSQLGRLLFAGYVLCMRRRRRWCDGGAPVDRNDDDNDAVRRNKPKKTKKERRNLDVKNYLIKKLLFLSFLIKF